MTTGVNYRCFESEIIRAILGASAMNMKARRLPLLALTLAAPQEAGESSKVEMKQGYAVVGFFGGLSLLAVVQLWGGAVNELLRAVLTIIGLMLAGGSGYISLTAMRKVADIGERMERIVDTARDAFVTIN